MLFTYYQIIFVLCLFTLNSDMYSFAKTGAPCPKIHDDDEDQIIQYFYVINSFVTVTFSD